MEVSDQSRAFLINAVILLSVLSGLWAGNYVVDPYRANRMVDVVPNKQAIASGVSHHEWLVARYRHERADIVLIGDSRMNRFDEATLGELVDLPVMNLSAGGARWRELLAMATYVLDEGHPKRIYLQLNVDHLNGSIRTDRASQARDLLEHPLRYYFHPEITRASATLLWHTLSKSSPASEAPPMDADAFWRWQLESVARISYANWTWPEQALRDLAQLSNRCEARGIALVVVMLPVHEDLRERFVDLGFRDTSQRLKRAIRGIAALVDFDRPSALTSDRSRFLDPYHLGGSYEDVAREMFGVAGNLADHTFPVTRPSAGSLAPPS
ncbi:MAG: hypothetical protein V3V08_00815 [Nannocystaceae bacterium]